MRVLDVRVDGQQRRILTYLEPDEVESLRGIPGRAIVGFFDAEEKLLVNGLFREFLHETIATTGPFDPGVQSAAQAHREGRLVYIDARVPEDVQPVPDEDILGWFRVRDGVIVAGSYIPNPRHRIDGAHGLCAAIDGMRAAMVRTLLQTEAG